MKIQNSFTFLKWGAIGALLIIVIMILSSEGLRSESIRGVSGLLKTILLILGSFK
ncbi:hypothetical protein OAA91_01155 [Fibrobacterales bacterium]|nr:hypothetical protein [Fibrobacterales bacterium]